MRKRIISIILTICLVAGMLFAGSLSANAEAGAVVIQSGSVDKSNTFYEFQVGFGDGGYTIESYGVRCDGVEATFELNKHEGSNWVLDGRLNVSSLTIGDHTLTAYINLYNRIVTSNPAEAIQWQNAGYNVQWATQNGPWFVEVRDGCERTVNLNVYCSHSNGHAKQTGHADATCTADGYTSYKCDLCSKEWTDKIPMLGHSFTQFVQTVAPTCADRGYNIYKCERCEATENRDYTDINPDNHASLKSTVTPPTCTTDGYTDYSCSSCGKSWRGDVTGQLNHDFSVYQYTVAPNCISQGYTVYKCSRCTITENRDYTERDYSNHANAYEITTVAPTCTDQGYTNYGCSSCGATWTGNFVDATGHSYNEGEITTDPTCTTDGVKTFSCSKCTSQKTEPVTKLGHSYKVTVVAPGCESGGYTKHECVRCASVYFDSQTDPSSHNPAEEFVTVVPASCFGVGVKVKYCTNCGKAVEVEEIPAGAHNPVEIPPVAATYESTGLTAGSKCSVCETILVEQQVTPKLTPPTAETNTQQGQDNNGTVHGETEQIDEKFTFDFFGIIKWIFENIIMKIFFIK